MTEGIGEAGNTASLPSIVACGDGYVMTTVIADPHWLFAWWTTDLYTGRSWLSVYRSPMLRKTSARYQHAVVLIGDAELLGTETIEDDSMMFATGELSMYGLPG